MQSQVSGMIKDTNLTKRQHECSVKYWIQVLKQYCVENQGKLKVEDQVEDLLEDEEQVYIGPRAKLMYIYCIYIQSNPAQQI